jgi:hypothetical protein
VVLAVELGDLVRDCLGSVVGSMGVMQPTQAA